MARQPLTAYLLGHRVTSLDNADIALREIGEELDVPENFDLAARLFVTTSPPIRPPWTAYLESVVNREVPLPLNSANGAILLVQGQTPADQARVVAFVFGGVGQHLLKRSWIEHGFGLRCALNACFPRNMPASALQSLRSIDSKAFDEVALDTRQLASRQVGFEVFGMNIRTDLLRAVLGSPVDDRAWGSRVRGHDSFSFSAVPGTSVNGITRRLLRLWHAVDYRAHFSWIDNIKPVKDDDLISTLEEVVVDAVRALRIDLVGPEELDLDRTRYYRIRGDVRVNQRFSLDLRSYRDRVGRENITIDRLKQDWIKSYDDDDQVVGQKAVFECLAGDLTLDNRTYVIADGEFYVVDRDFLRELDRDVGQLPFHVGMPNARLGEPEDAYNVRAAASPDRVLVDTKTIRLQGRTTPVEPCDLYSRNGAFIHVKRHVRSSTLSHLFSQGAVSGELLMTSETFRSELRTLLDSIEAERRRVDRDYRSGLVGTITLEPPARYAHEVVFAIIARWRDRPASVVLPFFSKLNLRQRSDELNRLGLKVSLARVEDR
jgi:uncharacterized protein (TIGR04141 family)